VQTTLKTSLLTTFDGSDREPRASQIEALSWLADNWSSPGLVLQLPTGIGKSAIARAIQLQTGAAILTPNNELLKQYAGSYPDLNTLMGSANYECADGGDHDDCIDCGYAKARSRATREPTVYNPLSYIYSPTRADCVVVDEAHKLLDFLRLLVSYRFSKAKYKYPECPDFNWVQRKADEYNSLGSLYKTQNDLKRANTSFQKAKTLKRIANLMETKPDDFISYFDSDVWVVEPIDVPRSIIEQALGKAKKVILLSATIPPKWAKEILGKRSFEYLGLDSTIPKENRKVISKASKLTSKSSPAEVAQWIKSQLSDHPGNAMVHVTYSMGQALSQYFPNAYLHTKDTKTSVLKQFKANGGLWIAAGAAEGIDLPGELCRTNLIPILPFANNRTPLGAVQFERDPQNYYLQTAIQFIQQAGRTTRGIDDWSVTICGDSRLVWLLKKCDNQLPSYFKKAIVWN